MKQTTEQMETAVLGGLLIDNLAFDEVRGIIRPAVFSSSAFQEIYKSIEILASKGSPVDLLTVCEALEASKKLEAVGGAFVVANLTNMVTSTANIKFHARAVVSSFLRREMLKITHWTAGELAAGANPYEVRTEAEAKKEALFNDFNTSETQHISKPSVINHLIDVKSGTIAPAISTGWEALDNILGGGFQRKELIVVGARPGMGKTAAALAWAVNGAEAGAVVAVISLEMGAVRLKTRLIGAKTGITPRAIKTGAVTEAQIKEIERAESDLDKQSIYLEDQDYSFEAITDKIRQLKKHNNVAAVFIDYLQLITTSQKFERRDLVIGHYTRELKQLARKIDAPIILLSQLSRPPKGQTPKRPTMTDLRESGNIEQDADVIIMIHRPDYYEKDDQPGLVEFCVEKNRDGETAPVAMRFNHEKMSFSDWETSEAVGDAWARDLSGYRPDADKIPF